MACESGERPHVANTTPVAPDGVAFVIAAVPREMWLEAAGTAQPYAEATLSTKLTGSVTAVNVIEGDRVRKGQVLVRIDARDLEAKDAQVAAALAEAEANRDQALTQAERMRSLFAEEAAPKAQLETAELALSSAEARVRSAVAAAAELGATREYSVIPAPFDGVVTRRFVDPGAFAAPGAPLVTVQDDSRLRVRVSAAPAAVRDVEAGDSIRATIEEVPAMALVEGMVPAPGGNLYTVNAILDNHDGRFLAHSAATLALPQGSRPGVVVPARALVRQGDLTGVRIFAPDGVQLRWVKVGTTIADSVEVLAGLRDGEKVLLPGLAEARR